MKKTVNRIVLIIFLFLSNQVIGIEYETIETSGDTILNNCRNHTICKFELNQGICKTIICNTEKDTLNLIISESGNEKYAKRNYFNLILPIITLFLGFILNRGFDYILERKRIKKDGERWFAEIRCLTSPISNQRKSIEKFLNALKIETFESPDLEIFQSLDCEIFKSLDKSALLKYLNRMEKDYSKSVDISNKIHGFISSLTFYYSNIKDRYEKYINNSLELFEKFNENFEHLIYCVAQYERKIEKETGQDPTNDETFNQISILFETHVYPHKDDGEIELFSLHKNLLTPLVDITTKNRLNDDLLELTHSLSKCNNTLKSIKAEKKYLIINLTNINESLLSLSSGLEIILKFNKY